MLALGGDFSENIPKDQKSHCYISMDIGNIRAEQREAKEFQILGSYL